MMNIQKWRQAKREGKLSDVTGQKDETNKVLIYPGNLYIEFDDKGNPALMLECEYFVNLPLNELEDLLYSYGVETDMIP